MLVDTGAQVSLIKNNAIPKHSVINTRNRISIKSLHGSETTLGEIQTNICEKQSKIPIQLQVTDNCVIKEDGILGYDIIGERAIVNGPMKTLTIRSRNSSLEFPINHIQQDETLQNEIHRLQNIEYLSHHENNDQYQTNLQRVKTITHEISQFKIQIKPI